MKPKKIKGILSLNKTTVSNLNGSTMGQARGGAEPTGYYLCASIPVDDCPSFRCPTSPFNCYTNDCTAVCPTEDWTCGEPDSVCVCTTIQGCF